jgi:pterin-4a-carbinolamine dehydratase
MSQTRTKPVVVSNPMQKLKAERVELMLARLPGWQASPDRTVLSRAFDLASPGQAARLAKQGCQWSARRRGEPWFSVSHKRLKVRLATPAVGGLTQADFEFARRLEEWVELLVQEETEKAAG